MVGWIIPSKGSRGEGAADVGKCPELRGEGHEALGISGLGLRTEGKRFS